MRKFAKTTFKLLDLLIIFVMTFGSPMSALADPSPTGATITTELPDYPPGSTVLMTGAGWAADEGVHVVVSADDQSWALASDPDPVADGAGGFTYEFTLPNWYVPTYTVSATGFTSGTATVTFTDAQGSSSKPYAHWSDEPLPGDWNNNILNDNKSNYFEGEVIPHVFIYEASNSAQLVNGQSYSFNVTYNWYQQNTDAGGFAYMTQYNLSRQPNVFDWATPAITPAADSTFTNGGGMAAGANFYTVDANITNVSAVTYTGTGTKDGHVTITFTYTGTTIGNGGYAAIYYGLYIAKPGEVPDQGAGKTNGANAWTGGSLQTTVDIGGSGATSLQLAPSAIIAGEISGLKFNDLNGNGSKDAGEPGLAGWTICLDSDTDPNNGNLGCVLTANGTTDDLDGNGVVDPVGFYYFSVTPGTYYVYEVNQAGWTQTAPSSVFFGPLVVSAITSTYLNQNFGNRFNTGSLQIVKTLNNPDGASVPASFTVNYDCGTGYTGQVSVAPGSPATVNGIPTGNTCTVTEVAPAAIPGFTWGTITYTPTSVTIGNVTTVTITVGNSITRDRGSLQIIKTLSNPDGASVPTSFTVNYDCGVGYTGSVSVAPGSPATVNGIPTGNTCTVTEVAPAAIPGYTWGTITYTPASVVISTGATVSITVGNSITRDLGNLKITKQTSNPNGATLPAAFTGTYDCGGSYTGNWSVANGGSQTISGIPTGSVCTVSEVTPAPISGYTWGTITYTPTSVTITTKGGTFEIVVGNSITRDQGYLKITKNFDPKTSGFNGTFDIVYNCGAGNVTVSLAVGGSTTVGPFDTGTVCTVSEPTLPTAPADWIFDSPSISGSPVTIAKGDAASAQVVTVTNSITHLNAAISLTKSASSSDVCIGSNAQITYTYVVKNTGEVNLTGTVVDDNGTPPNTDDDVTVGNFTNLAPGASQTFTHVFTVNSTTTNTATATGTSAGSQTATANASATVTGHTCSISITKSPNKSDVCNGANTSVTYTYVVTNTGSFFNASGSVTDDNGTPGNAADDVAIGTFTDLAPGTSTSFTHAFTVNGTTTNTATASGTSGGKSVSASASATVTGRNCTISVTKTPRSTNVCNGSSVTYDYTVTNNSFFTWSGSLSDSVLGTIDNSITLAPGASKSFSAAGTINGTVTNTATASGSFNDPNSTSASASASATVTGHNCTISVTKTPSAENVCNGSSVTYTYTVHNNSDAFTWTGSLTDDQLGSVAASITLTPGQTKSFTKADSVTGDITNTAIASGAFNDPASTSASASASATVHGHVCNITVTKTPSQSNVCNGSSVTYTYTVKNNSDTFNWSGSLTDSVLGSVATSISLTPGETKSFTKAGTVTGDVTNTATATGTFNDPNITSASASASATVHGHVCNISITKSPSVSQVCNSTNTSVTYTYVVKNNSDFYSVSGSVTDNQLGAIGTFTNLAPGASQTFTKAATINATTNNTGTANGTFNDGSNTSATASASATVTGMPCQIVIKKIIKPTGSQTSFAFDANGTGYVDFSLSDQQTNTQNLLPGTYTVKELVPLGWVLTGIGGAPEPNPFNCTITGSGGSVGLGDLNTQTATITLKMGDIVTCVFENTGQGVTRTQGFWATHPQLAQIAWFGGTAYGHTFPGVAATAGIGDNVICGRPIDTLGKLMGGFWSDVSKKSAGAKRTALDQGRMQLLQQLLAAELNASAFGSTPSGGTGMFAAWESALCGTNQSAISNAQGQAASFNSAGDSSTFTPGTSAQSKYARSIANIPFWDIIKP